ncbi:hypothetical protein CYMTET_33477 [Cymbomonas tetramitiformis]|uniref:Uncharacterized protein n=1 Tax=Cymbomonas tetramitiformis TaxID=36881 RepID=A0AAE0KR59_9CHLO|nr:hypothetical protein CYMTET_33477 [Cymbomonas tetramitiformis]
MQNASERKWARENRPASVPLLDRPSRAASASPARSSASPSPSRQLYSRSRLFSGRAVAEEGRPAPTSQVLTAKGTLYQYFLSPDQIKNNARNAKREERHWRHFDVFCEWDKGNDAFDTYELADSMRHSRLTYSYSLFRRDSPLSELKEEWKDFQSQMEVDFESLAKWVNALTPKSIHDFKPLIVLLQSILKVLLNKEFAFFSSRIRELEALLEEARAVIRAQVTFAAASF